MLDADFSTTHSEEQRFCEHTNTLLQLLCFYLVLGWMSALYFKTMIYNLTIVWLAEYIYLFLFIMLTV